MCPAFFLLSMSVDQFSSTTLTLFAYKQILQPQVQTNSTFTTEISHFTLSRYAPQLTHILLPILLRRAPRLCTTIWVWPSPATATTFSFCRSTLFVSTLLVPSTSSSTLAVISTALLSPFSSSVFLFSNCFLSPRGWFSSSFSFLFKTL